jgi:hypothetical protein
MAQHNGQTPSPRRLAGDEGRTAQRFVSPSIRSGAPIGPVAVASAVTVLAGNAVVTPVWRNELGGLTFRLVDANGVRYLK